MIFASALIRSNFRILLPVCYAYLRVISGFTASPFNCSHCFYSPIEFEPVKNAGIRNIHQYYHLRDVRKTREKEDWKKKTMIRGG